MYGTAGLVLVGMVGMVGTGCGGPAARSGATTQSTRLASRIAKPSRPQPVDATPPPAIHATGTDYVAIARSLTAYRTWLFAHHPDTALAPEIYTRGTATYTDAVADLDRVRAHHEPSIPIGRLAFTTVSVDRALVTLRARELAPDIGSAAKHYVVVMTRDVRGRWRIADFTAVAPAADDVGSGTLGGTPPALGVGLLVSAPSADGSGPTTYQADDPSAPSPFYTRAIPAEAGDGAALLSNLCHTPNGSTDPPFDVLGNGWIFNVELFATADGRHLGTVGIVCVALDPTAPDVVPPTPVLPLPPTIGEIWRTVALPAATIGANPDARGVTGLPTWVWTGGSTAPVGVAANLDGYTITGTARVVGFAVYSGEGSWVRGERPGTPDDPAFAHTYEKTGTYRLGVATLWSADAVLSVPGIAAPITIDLGTAIVTYGRDYPVIQIRSRLL